MDYSLAKRLKEAGFKQCGNGRCAVTPPGLTEEDIAYSPTLEELIEALGHDFLSVGKYIHSRAWPKQQWYAKQKITGRRYLKVIADTPIEAVANLWLHLNTHNTPQENL